MKIQLPADDISQNNARRGWREAFHRAVYRIGQGWHLPFKPRRNQACLPAPAVKQSA
jgi:hypothetical protein